MYSYRCKSYPSISSRDHFAPEVLHVPTSNKNNCEEKENTPTKKIRKCGLHISLLYISEMIVCWGPPSSHPSRQRDYHLNRHLENIIVMAPGRAPVFFRGLVITLITIVKGRGYTRFLLTPGSRRVSSILAGYLTWFESELSRPSPQFLFGIIGKHFLELRGVSP